MTIRTSISLTSNLKIPILRSFGHRAELARTLSRITTPFRLIKPTLRFGESVWVPTMDTPFPGLKLRGIVKATIEL